jgi:hypothetical protein
MKTTSCFGSLLGFFLLAALVQGAPKPLAIQVQPRGTKVAISWPGDARVRVAGVQFKNFELQQSFDLVQWQPLRLVPAGTNGSECQVETEVTSCPAFYRVLGYVEPSPEQPGGEQVFGFQDAFKEALAAIGQISPEEFAARYTLTNQYLEQISWDPTTACYWSNFNAEPKIIWGNGDYRITNDFRLDPTELAVLKKNGFVIAERMGAHSFAELYYRIFYSDLPVFVTADSILQAWHRSYEALLEELEEFYLLPSMSNLVSALREKLALVGAQYGTGPMTNSILDVDYYLAVASSLFNAAQVPSQFDQDSRVLETLEAIDRAQLEEFVLFDRRHGNPNEPHRFDFSQFVVRGHYTKTAELRRYFRGMMWLGLVDFRVAGNPDDPSPRELGSAIVLNQLLRDAGKLADWDYADQIIRVFVGIPDSMGFREMGALLDAAGIQSLADLSESRLVELQQSLMTGRLGMQAIEGHPFWSPLGPEQLVLPRSFTVFGQRFTLDSWAFSQVVFDRIIWDTNGIPGFEDKVERRMPSGLDVAFSVLDNGSTVPELVLRIANLAGRAFRDGLPYQHNLASVRQVVDSQTPESWDASIYTMWLAALRELSAPTTDPVFTEAMRTRAWAGKNLSTQLASWAHLRHNTMLYVKESVTSSAICSYPYGFVEPRVKFWARLRAMAERSATLLASLPYKGNASFPVSDPWYPWLRTTVIPMSDVKAAHVKHLTNFAATVGILETLATKELAHQPLTTNDLAFLNRLVENTDKTCVGERFFTGWYPALFYEPFRRDLPTNAPYASEEARSLSDQWDPLIATVHTDPPDPWTGDPGGVLHQAVGNVNLLLIAVETGPEPMIFAGPVLSYYEFATTNVVRLTDQDWRSQIVQTNLPPFPDWERDFKVPGSIAIPAYVR